MCAVTWQQQASLCLSLCARGCLCVDGEATSLSFFFSIPLSRVRGGLTEEEAVEGKEEEAAAAEEVEPPVG